MNSIEMSYFFGLPTIANIVIPVNIYKLVSKLILLFIYSSTVFFHFKGNFNKFPYQPVPNILAINHYFF